MSISDQPKNPSTTALADQLVVNTKHSYLYNPTDEWITATLTSGDQNHMITVIPPRSARPFPSSLASPTISAKSFPPEQIQSFGIDSITASSVIIDPISIVLNANWKGTLVSKGKKKDVDAFLWVDRSFISGIVFLPGNKKAIVKGSIRMNTHVVIFSIYKLKSKKEDKLEGKINFEDGVYTIDAKSQNMSINLVTKEENKLNLKPYHKLAGNYLVFYTKEDSQNEMTLSLKVWENGFLTGSGCEGRSHFQVIGFFSENEMNLIRFGNEVSYFDGTISMESEVYISGNWCSKTKSEGGNFTFIKEM